MRGSTLQAHFFRCRGLAVSIPASTLAALRQIDRWAAAFFVAFVQSRFFCAFVVNRLRVLRG
jgi:hypothetical protein